MKNTLFIVALLCLNFTAYSQFNLGVKATTSTVFTPADTQGFVSLSPNQISRISVGETEKRHAYGLFGIAENEKLFFMLEGLYTSSSQRFQMVATGLERNRPDPATELYDNSSSIRLIATGGVKYKNFRLGAGPEISMVLSREETLSQLRNFEKQDAANLGGFDFLLGYTFLNHIQLDIKYVKYFANIGSNYHFDGIPVSFKGNPSMIELSLGFHL